MKTGQIQVFCNRSIKFVHPADPNTTHMVRNHTFEYAPSWIKDTDIFKALLKDSNIKVIESTKDLKDTEVSGKVIAKKMQEIEEEKVVVPVTEDVKEDVVDYSSMKAKALYELCVERGIEVEEQKSKAYYIEKLNG